MLRVRTTELMDSLVTDIYHFVVETVPGVTRDRRAPHFAEVEPVELPFSTRGIPQRCLQPHILPYHRLKRWVTKAGARTTAEAPSLEEEIHWTRRGGRPIHRRDLVYLVPEYTPLRKLIQSSTDHSYAQPPPATQERDTTVSSPAPVPTATAPFNVVCPHTGRPLPEPTS